jgi:hypothetical protein
MYTTRNGTRAVQSVETSELVPRVDPRAKRRHRETDTPTLDHGYCPIAILDRLHEGL